MIKLLDEANRWHANIKLDYKIGRCLPFLDLLVMNQNGILSTSVYHKPAAEPYIVPFISDHPRHVFGNVIQTSLARAIRYSSIFETYQSGTAQCQTDIIIQWVSISDDHAKVIVYIDVVLLSYPSSFIEKEFQNFYRKYIQQTPFLPFIPNEKQFILIRTNIKHQPTPQQSTAMISARRADTPNHPTNGKPIQSKETPKGSEKNDDKNASKLIVHYIHERRFHLFKRDMHLIYEHIFERTPAADVKMIVGN